MPKQPVPPEIPEFRFVKPLGRGGMATVWLAVRREDGVPVAVKILARLDSETERRMFQKEAVVCLNLDHENIVRGLAIGEADEQPWLAMEYVEGESLQTLIERSGPLEEREALRVSLEAARGLSEAARVGVVHRDVKPANLMIDPSGRVKVCDLGLVSPSGKNAPRAGTPLFMAPELIAGDGEVDHRADIYSLGLTLYFAVTGENAFAAKTPRRIIARQLRTELPDPRKVRPDLSIGLANVLRKMTAKAPKDRYRLWAELRIDLEHLMRGESPLSAAISAIGKAGVRRRWLFPTMAGAAAALAAVVVIAVAGRSGGAPSEDPREAEARGQLAYVEEFLARSPDDLASARDELLELQERFPGTTAGDRAAEMAAELESRIDSAEEQVFAVAAETVETRLAALDFDGALATASKARWKLQGTEREPRLVALESRVGTHAAEYLADLRAEVAPLIAGGDLDGARSLLANAARSAVAGISAWIDSALDEIDMEVRRRSESDRAAARERYATAVQEAFALARTGNFEAARAKIADDGDPEALGNLPGIDGTIVSSAEQALATASKGAADFLGKDLALVSDGKLLLGRLEKVDATPGKALLLLEGRTRPIAVPTLDGATLKAFSGSAPALDLAALALVRGERSRAIRLLRYESGPVADRIRDLLPPEETPGGPVRPVEGGAAEADRLAAAGRWVDAFRIDPGIRDRNPARDPEGARALDARGLDEYVLGHVSSSLEIFRQSIEADPFAGEPRLNRARALLGLARANRSPVLLEAIRADLEAAAIFRPDLAEAGRLLAALDRITPD